MTKTLQGIRRREAGFTLLEILLVVVIISMLVTVAVVQLGGRGKEAKVVACKDQIHNYETALDLYELDNGFLPTTEQGLQALLAPPGSPPVPANWKGPYLKPAIIRDDPWQGKYLYKNPGTHNTTSYDLYSLGPMQVEGDAGNVGNWH